VADPLTTVRDRSNLRIKQSFERDMPSPHFSTKERILAAAEMLFAQQGFAETSLREVTSRADVNLAAVNYHFGSKSNLINEVFRRRLDELSGKRLAALTAAERDHAGKLDVVLAAFIEPALELSLDRQGGSAFVRVIARAYAEKDEGLRQFLSDNYGHVMREFARAILACLPELRRDQLYWRLDFIAGALTYAMADFGQIKRPDHVSEAEHCRQAASELIRFATAGLRAG
jgi:AcrR family transcriptional regulator